MATLPVPENDPEITWTEKLNEIILVHNPRAGRTPAGEFFSAYQVSRANVGLGKYSQEQYCAIGFARAGTRISPRTNQACTI